MDFSIQESPDSFPDVWSATLPATTNLKSGSKYKLFVVPEENWWAFLGQVGGQLLYKVKLTCVFACMVVSMRTKPSDFCLAARSSQDMGVF